MAPHPSGGFRLFDHSVVDPLAPSYVGRSSRTTLAAARLRDKVKRDKYAADAADLGHTLHPISLETTGGFGPHFERLFRDWVRVEREAEEAAGGTGWLATAASIRWQQRIFVTLQQSLGARMVSRLSLHTHVRRRFGLPGLSDDSLGGQ